MLLAGDFCSPGCPEHCVLACWWDGFAKGFNGKKNASQQTWKCNQIHLLALSLSCKKHALHRNTLNSRYAQVCTVEEKAGWDLYHVAAVWCSLSELPFALLDVNSKAPYVCENLDTDFIRLNWVFCILGQGPFSQISVMKPSFNLCAIFDCAKTVSVFSLTRKLQAVADWIWVQVSSPLDRSIV